MRIKLVLLLVVATVLLPFKLAAEPAKTAANPAYTWDLTELYATTEDWDKARKALLDDLSEIEAKKGTLGKSPKHLLNALELIYGTAKEMSHIYSYASMMADEDLRATDNQERDQLATIAYTRFGESFSWLEPEILAIGERKLKKFLKKEPKLEIYRHMLEDTLRSAPHTLNTEGEALLSLFANPFTAPNSIYSLMANSDIPWPMTTLSDGQQYRIDSQGYGRWRQSASRDDRKKVFDAYWGKWLEYRNSVGAVLNSHIQNQVALAKARNYDSVLQRELGQENLPEAVYRNLVKEVNAALPTLHRYFKLRGKILGVEQMHYYDIYPPLVALEKEFDYQTSNQITLEAMAILGDDWVSMQREGMKQRWIHVYPQEGKRSGAYMNGAAYDLHPYMLLNHDNTYDSLSTLAHEWGHAMHTLYAVQSQPYPTYDYSTFIAEIPSTSLELILQRYMVKNAKTPQEKIFYLGSGLESMRSTFFRQTMFAEFELSLYESVERGEALTGEKISKMYGEILKRYHGHDQRVLLIDELYTNEWMFIPHFYYNMYVYQYATSMTAGTALYDKIVTEGEAGVANYKNLLRAGGSDYPYNLLKNAGVDLASEAPFKAMVKQMNLIMDEIEVLLAELEASK